MTSNYLYLRKNIRRFFKKLFCFHEYKDRVGYSKRRKKHVDQCLHCGKLFYTNKDF